MYHSGALVAEEVGTYELQGLVGEAVVVLDELSDVKIEIRPDPLRWRGGDDGKRFRPSSDVSFLRNDDRMEIANP